MIALLEELVEYETLADDFGELVLVDEATFKKDFGLWLAGDKCAFLQLVEVNGKIELQEVDDLNNVKKKVRVTLTVVNA